MLFFSFNIKIFIKDGSKAREAYTGKLKTLLVENDSLLKEYKNPEDLKLAKSVLSFWCLILGIILFVHSRVVCRFSSDSRYGKRFFIYRPLFRDMKRNLFEPIVQRDTLQREDCHGTVGRISSWKSITKGWVPAVGTCQSGRESGIRVAYSRTLNSVPSSAWKAQVSIALQRPSHFKEN